MGKNAVALDFKIINQDDWTPYRIHGDPEPRNLSYNRGCWRLQVVSHVTHLDTVEPVLAQGIVGRPFTEDPRFAGQGFSVAWVSPAAGRDGSHYGNVSFDLDWSALSSQYRTYWVGAKRYDNPWKREPFEVPVIFLTHRACPWLKVYERESRTGPWWHDTAAGEHRWNGCCWLEFMIDLSDGPLPLSALSRISFADHHTTICARARKTGHSCSDNGLTATVAEIRLLAGVVTGAIRVPNALYSPVSATSGATLNLEDSLETLYSTFFTSRIWPGTVKRGSARSQPQALQFLSALWSNHSTAPAMLDDFASLTDAWISVEDAIVTMLGHTGWRSRIREEEADPET